MNKPLPTIPRAPVAPPRHSLAHAAFCNFLNRAAVTGAQTDVAGWASELVGQAVGEFVSTLPNSAAAQLIARGMQITFEAGVGSVKIPTRAAGPTAAQWVAEGAEIPARQWILSGNTL